MPQEVSLQDAGLPLVEGFADPSFLQEITLDLEDTIEHSGWRKYGYQPLETIDTIRIFVLHPAGNSGDPLVGRLEHKPRRDPASDVWIVQDYIAISYAWGKPVFTHKVLCDGAFLPITSNVDAMLRDLRKVNHEQRLWIDAICLNQSDPIEKASQIPRMRQIYESAARVYIWLRPANNSSSTDPAPHIFDLVRCIRAGNNKVNESQDSAIEHFPKKPWFRRRWVIQESTAHRDTRVFCDGKSMHWGEITTALATAINAHASGIERRAACMIKSIENLQQHPASMLELLEQFHDFDCSDPRDRLAALHAVAKHAEKEWLGGWSVDYTKDTVFNYRHFTELAIISNYGFKIRHHLELFGSLRDTIPEAPKWVPNWTRNKLARQLYTVDLGANTVSLAHNTYFWGAIPSARRCTVCYMANELEANAEYLDRTLEIESTARISQRLNKSFNERILACTSLVSSKNASNTEVECCLRDFLVTAARRTRRTQSLSKDVAHLLNHVIILPDAYQNDPRTGLTLCGCSDGAMADWISTLFQSELSKYKASPEVSDLVEDPSQPVTLDSSFNLLELSWINDLVIPTLKEFLQSHVFFATQRLVGVAKGWLTEDNFVAIERTQLGNSNISRQRAYLRKSRNHINASAWTQIDRGVLIISHIPRAKSMMVFVRDGSARPERMTDARNSNEDGISDGWT